MFCSKCGTNNPDEGRFCVSCGAGLPGQAGVSAAAQSAIAPPIPGLAPPYVGPAETSGKAIASLICGIFFLVFPAAVAAVILGHLSLSEIKKSAGRLKGHGMAMTGLVLGYLGTAGLIPVAVILIIAAIAIPNLIRARIVANETSAQASLRRIDAAALNYSEAYSNGFPPSLIAMDGVDAGSPSCDHAQLIDSVLAAGQMNGYVFTYVALPEVEGQERPVSAKAAANGCTVGGADSFSVAADPITRGTTGMRSYFVDQTGVIRWEQNGPASADSPTLGDSQSF
jgi:type IV pilus assembly protein PilA